MLMIILGIYIVVSIVGAAEMVIRGTEEAKRENHVEDGEFSVFVPLTDAMIESLSQRGTVIERMFSFDAEANDGSMLRVFSVREYINKITLDEGSLPITRGGDETTEAVIEMQYAKAHSIEVGDRIIVDERAFIISGIGTVPDYDAVLKTFSTPAADAENFGLMFVPNDIYTDIVNQGRKSENYTYAFRLGDKSADDLKDRIKALEFDYTKVEDVYFREKIGDALDQKEEVCAALRKLSDGTGKVKDGAGKLKEGIAKLGLDDGGVYEGAAELDRGMRKFKSEAEDLLDEVFAVEMENLTGFVKADENQRIAAAAGDVVMDKKVGLVAGVIVLILFAYVISVFVVHQIEREQSVIGALYSMGVKKGDLLRHYVKLPTMLAFLAGCVGCALAFSPLGVDMMAQNTYDYFSIPDFDRVYPIYLIVYGALLPPVICLLVNILTINKKLSKTALSLLRNEQSPQKQKNYDLRIRSFTRLFAVRQLLREARSAVIILIGMLITMMVMVLGINTSVLCTNIKNRNVADTKYEYMYLLKYPMKEVPKEAEATYIKSLTIDCEGYNLDVSVIGIDKESRYFTDVTPEKGKNKAVINASLKQRFGFDTGDKILLEDKAMDVNYSFSITDVSDYSVGFVIFMDIRSMRDLFGEDADYVNALYADEELAIEEGRLYSVTSKKDIEHSSAVFLEMMRSLTVTLLAAGSIICCVVMYLMMAVMIDRSAKGISLLRIFGYRFGEVRKLYLNGNTAVVAIGGLFVIPLAKRLIDTIYPSFIANVACSMDLHYPWFLYAGIYLGLLCIYFAVNVLLLRKIRSITPAEVLKDRE